MLNVLRSWLATQPARQAEQTRLSEALQDEDFLDGTVRLLRHPDEISRRLAELYDSPDGLQLWQGNRMNLIQDREAQRDRCRKLPR